MKFQTADLCDAYGEQVQVCEPLLRSFGGQVRFSGPIATLKVQDDNTLVREALETLPEGTVLVVDGQASTRCALLGDNLAAIAVNRRLGGIIIHGCVRDSGQLRDMDLGIMALAAVPRKSRKEGKGERDVHLQFGGVQWEPGCYVYADEDGIILAKQKLTVE
ncbi:ribonuclease E activity regulator RraA [Ectobacillus ponti]|uniref:4-hydroxy-4-methyl-2-oxoglutarate aldolase n=1 Tax=Ectobacillus ponti TaxID=2961894 RepID=A0AA42BQX0_9BACI|nr:ribonuclease E activity regulator RraA [Ectobacillus ponti]MCP8970705.1 ribonuclease E activity regulator RraA [Ectobacillus ponti]